MPLRYALDAESSLRSAGGPDFMVACPSPSAGISSSSVGASFCYVWALLFFVDASELLTLLGLIGC